jgi:hypothetical protein
MKDFKEVSPQDRMLMLAKLYHNMWYDKSRYEVVRMIVEKWDSNPIKEAKFLNQIHDGTEIKETELR